jgi:hypothetical protein
MAQSGHSLKEKGCLRDLSGDLKKNADRYPLDYSNAQNALSRPGFSHCDWSFQFLVRTTLQHE